MNLILVVSDIDKQGMFPGNGVNECIFCLG